MGHVRITSIDMSLTRTRRYRDSASGAPNQIKVLPNVKRRGSYKRQML
jgi:hypothetical protein